MPLYTCGCLSHTHHTMHDRDRCVRGDVPCTEVTHQWSPLPTGLRKYVQQTCLQCGITRLVSRLGREVEG